ncbi:hypothetical protein BC826DRAFT_741792 [Russula brevipes]|nr:hypothetical protein BC826DRAFT_741792 [Russula brevipes]
MSASPPHQLQSRKSQLHPNHPSRHEYKKPEPTGDTPPLEKTNRTHHQVAPMTPQHGISPPNPK